LCVAPIGGFERWTTRALARIAEEGFGFRSSR
jgi:hypothetical protein